MQRSKRGDLAISTNAIVILIIAVIMLGLIIGFVTRGFESISKKFEAEAARLPDPPAPTNSQPISVTENIIAKAGETFVLKISVYNGGDSTLSATPTLNCDAEALESQQMSIPAKKIGVGIAAGTLNTVGVTLCQASMDINGETYMRDFVVEVRQ